MSVAKRLTKMSAPMAQEAPPMSDFLSAYSIQNWLESCPQGYLEGTTFGHASSESEPAPVPNTNPVIRP